MPHTTFQLSSSPSGAEADFSSPEGLRALLVRLHQAGPGAWRHDAEAAELMRHAAQRYAALARKHGLQPEDAAAAAFEAMLNESTRTAHDPWAVVTVAVRITLIAEERAHGLLCSTDRARRATYSQHPDAQRFSDREADLTEFHPALQVAANLDQGDDESPEDTGGDVVETTVTLFELLGWASPVAAAGVEYVAARLMELGGRQAAYEVLRRDKTARAQVDLPHSSWIGLLQIVLGYPHSPRPSARHGVIARLLTGEQLTDLLGDDALVDAIVSAAPGRGFGPWATG